MLQVSVNLLFKIHLKVLRLEIFRACPVYMLKQKEVKKIADYYITDVTNKLTCNN